MSKIDALVFLSDLHCGSPYAIMPPEYTMHDGETIKANALQQWYYECLLDALAWTRSRLRGRKWGLVLNGDLLEGVHHGTKEVVSADPGDHKGIAIAVLSPWAEYASSVWVVEGTECHTNRSESEVGRALGAVPYRNPSVGSKVHAWPELPLTVNGCYGIVRHHITTSVRPWTEATGLGTQLNSERIEHVRAGQEPPKWCVYAHRHKEGHYSDGHGAVWVLPPWQGLTRHGRKVVGHARFARPGVLILDFKDIESDGLPVAYRRVYGPSALEVQHA